MKSQEESVFQAVGMIDNENTWEPLYLNSPQRQWVQIQCSVLHGWAAQQYPRWAPVVAAAVLTENKGGESRQWMLAEKLTAQQKETVSMEESPERITSGLQVHGAEGKQEKVTIEERQKRKWWDASHVSSVCLNLGVVTLILALGRSCKKLEIGGFSWNC